MLPLEFLRIRLYNAEMRLLHMVAGGCLATCVMFAQATAQPLGFEAVSVKRTRDAPRQSGNSCSGGPGTGDPGLFRCEGAALSLLVAMAYNLQYYELVAPDWMNIGGVNGYDIVARMTPSTTKEQFRGMLQTMLAQRFLLATHWGEKPYPEYTLRIEKGGLKVKPVQDQGVAPAGKDGVAASEVKPKFSMKVVGGYMHLEFVRKPFSMLADVLGTFVTGRVSDGTGRAEVYDFTLDFMPDDRWRGFDSLPKPAETPDVPNLEVAVKQQLGLMLERRPGTMRVLVVDKAEKSPTEN